MKINEKEESDIQNEITECILAARIKIAKLDTGEYNPGCHQILKEVDEILFNLERDCPVTVIEILKKEK